VHTTVAALSSSSDVAVAVPNVDNDGDMVRALGSNLVTKLPATATARAGDTIHLTVDAGKVHLFDPDGPSLRRGATS
ncbi:MAG: hypothetical protein QOC57_2087, partial [Ilumatobacteraceae bacterium]